MMSEPTSKEMKHGIRKSRMQLNEVYFWTDTIKDWKMLLSSNEHKEFIMECWQELIRREKIRIYGFVIMPNHLHIVWEMLAKNGKEMPHASFNKFTSHQFLKSLQLGVASKAIPYAVNKDPERVHRFWQSDPLAIKMFSRKVVEQKLEYIHLNPLQERWNLVERPEDYHWSSAKFYETGVDEFNILTHYRERF